MEKYCLALKILNPLPVSLSRGGGPDASNLMDVYKGFSRAARGLLAKHQVDAQISSPSAGFWFVPFTLKNVHTLDEAREQADAISDGCKQLVRTVLQRKFGMALGSEINFRVAVFPVPDSMRDNEEMARHLENVIGNIMPHTGAWTGVPRDEFVSMIKNRDIRIYLQPVVSLASGMAVGYEALARGPEDGSLHQAYNLFEAAAHFGLREALEMACIAEALEWAAEVPSPYWLSINVGPDLFASESFYEYIAQWRFEKYHRRIVFEITEHLPVFRVKEFLQAADRVRKLGIRLALDDTGCGFTDINTVRMLRPDIAKICISIVRRIGGTHDAEAEIRNIVKECGRFGTLVLAEGVERPDQTHLIKRCGVPLAQGFLYGRPQPAVVFLPVYA